MGHHGIEILTDVEVTLVTIFMIVQFIFSYKTGVVACMHSCIWRPLCYRNEPVFVQLDLCTCPVPLLIALTLGSCLFEPLL
jgi:hypothetical protein